MCSSRRSVVLNAPPCAQQSLVRMQPAAEPFSGERVRFASRVLAVGQGWIELERPLLYGKRSRCALCI